MRIVCISDTHGKHRLLKLPKGDIIIHAGDVSFEGSDHQTEDCLHWFSRLDFEHKIFIAGNHDFYFEDLSQKQLAKDIPPNVIYLNDSGAEVNGLRIWGSPVTPWNFDWAFNRHRGPAIARHWKLIPSDTDILITHGPPAGILDKTVGGHRVYIVAKKGEGSEAGASRVRARARRVRDAKKCGYGFCERQCDGCCV